MLQCAACGKGFYGVNELETHWGMEIGGRACRSAIVNYLAKGFA